MSIRVIIGDVREQLKTLADESVHCVVTSPPYFGLRDYGTGSWEGGDPACDHRNPIAGGTRNKGRDRAASNGKFHDAPSIEIALALPFRDVCGLCNATRTDKQIGLEPTPAEFVAVMVEVFREVRRVLRKDGTCWINLGDSYATGTSAPSGASKTADVGGWTTRSGDAAGARRVIGQGYKPKDLMGIPWRVAFALQADGWYLRQDIIWSKPNPMPESVTDRCTKAHEYLFLMSKSPRYHYDAEAIAEAVTESTVERLSQPNLENQAGSDRVPGKTNGAMKAVGKLSPHMEGTQRNDGDRWRLADGGVAPRGNRNRRSVWTVATQPFKEAHFATFPPDLIEPCIKAGCPKDCCAKCGAPVVREVEKSFALLSDRQVHRGKGGDKGMDASNGWGDMPRGTTSAVTTGWSPSCSCDAGLVRGTVLDPFGGAGTTGLVADRLQRDAILIELNPEYMAMAKERITDDGPLFAVLL